MSQMRSSELDPELKAVMAAIEHGKPFDMFPELSV